MNPGDVDGSQTASRKRRRRLSRRMAKFRLFRVLSKDWAFTAVFLVVVLVVGLVGLGALRIWTTTPPGWKGATLRISALDWIQAWSLQRSAKRLALEGKSEQALYTWRAAVARNLGDPEGHRRILEMLRASPVPTPANLVIAEASAQWLTRLTGTNRTDLPLIGDVLERYGRPAAALALIDAVAPGGAVDGELLRIRARCLLRTGDFDGFARIWKERPPDSNADAAFVLHGDAWEAATDEGTRGIEALGRLRAAADSSASNQVIAARLLVLVGQRRQAVEVMDRGMTALRKSGADTTADHVAVWRTLMKLDRLDEARERARAYSGTPMDSAVAARYVSTLTDLGMGKEAIAFLDQNMKAYGASVDVWAAYFDALIREARWSEFRRATATARLLTTRQEGLHGEVLFAELRAAIASNRKAEADRAATELMNGPFTDVVRLATVAGALREAGKRDEGWALLQRSRAAFAQGPEFWLEWFRSAAARLDLENLRVAADALARLLPGDPRVDQVRAGLLLVAGEEPAEALRLTLTGFQRAPENPAVRLNHAFALVRNGRAADAVTVLAPLARERLSPELGNAYQLALAEVADAESRFDDAGAAAGRVRDAELFPAQRERLEAIRARAAAQTRGTP